MPFDLDAATTDQGQLQPVLSGRMVLLSKERAIPGLTARGSPDAVGLSPLSVMSAREASSFVFKYQLSIAHQTFQRHAGLDTLPVLGKRC